MSEDEAKTKWCHQTMDFSRCVGSECMAWRKLYEVNPEDVLGENAVYGTVTRLREVGGYCGLAGKP